jgi:hypothetical protein
MSPDRSIVRVKKHRSVCMQEERCSEETQKQETLNINTLWNSGSFPCSLELLLISRVCVGTQYETSGRWRVQFTQLLTPTTPHAERNSLPSRLTNRVSGTLGTDCFRCTAF